MDGAMWNFRGDRAITSMMGAIVGFMSTYNGLVVVSWGKKKLVQAIYDIMLLRGFCVAV